MVTQKWMRMCKVKSVKRLGDCSANFCSLIPSFSYKGKWHPSLISNPAYKGKWKPGRIPNPDYYHDADPFARMTAIGAVGIELWSMSSDIYFDNVLITDDMDIATGWAAETFELKVSHLLYRVIRI